MLPIFLNIVIVFSLGFIAYEQAKPTVIPSFVLAIFFGFVSQDILHFISSDSTALSTLTTIGAVFILFGGGLETPFNRFRALVGPILSLAFLGTILTAIIFSLFLAWFCAIMNFSMPIPAIVLLGVALASTDPAAIIPSFKSLLFTKPRVKHVAISESALNDVIGALITGIFLSLFLGGYMPESILSAYTYLFNLENLLEIIKVIGIGCLAGVIGFLTLRLWSNWKEKIETEGEADSALFLAVPLFAYTLATMLGGNGFLAVFIAGLLFQIKAHFSHVEHFFNHTIEGFMKPLIFMLLGTLVHPQELWQVAPIGILMGILFMFFIRPLVIFISLGIFCKSKQCFTLKEMLFLSFVRETGVIPAVLLVGINISGLPGSDLVVAIGMWIILLTLVIQPPLTPLIAKKLDLAKDLPSFPKQAQKGPVAVLCSRGYSFLDRIEAVVDWCEHHGTENILLLHCPEEKFANKFNEEIKKVADKKFQNINSKLSEENQPIINFKLLILPGLLEDNIEAMLVENQVSILFVGNKMLDFRLDELKRLQAPFVFLD
ncbi:MAG: cation:proton antiporter [Candidatus Altimarinota bacterium]